MNRCASYLGALLLLAGGLMAPATQPVFENTSPVQAPPQIPPQVDATVFINRSLFDISTFGKPYEFTSTLFYTNAGVMYGQPGYRFDFVTNQGRYASEWFVNEGELTVSTNLLVLATNILNSGGLFTGPGGIIRLYATNSVDVERARLRSGPSVDTPFTSGGIFFGDDYFYNDPGITDLYWAAGYNNNLTNRTTPMPLYSFPSNFFTVPNFAAPYASSPYHEVRAPGFSSVITYSTVVPGSFFSFMGSDLYDVWVRTNALSPSNSVVQMVFAPTNHIDTNMTTEVRFLSDFDSQRAIPVVRFSTFDYDLVLDRFVTNHVYVIDETATVTNTALQANFYEPTTFRPASLAITRGLFSSFDFLGTTNAVFTNDLVYNPGYRTNAVPVRYAAYAAQVGLATAEAGFGFNFFLSDLALRFIEPTNMPGRVEIIGETVNLENARVRAESLFSVKASNLVGNALAYVDAPYLIYDLGTTNTLLSITNLAPASVRRVTGQVSAWSGVWTNFADTLVTTNDNGTNVVVGTNSVEIAFHALVVENLLTTVRPVVVHEFSAHAPNLEISDNVAVGRALFIEATNLHVRAALELPPGYDWATTNIAGLRNLTNDGSINIPGTGYFGEGPTVTGLPALPYDNFVNHGYVLGATHLIRAHYFENTASPALINSGLLSARSGLLSVIADTGNVIDGQLLANGDVQIRANNWTTRGTAITAGISNLPGTLILSVTNRLTDEGTNAHNQWLVSAGVRLLVKPATGDLLGTHLTSQIPRAFGRADHFWAGEDRGTNVSGYTDNAALGQLTLDGANASLFNFSAVTGGNALYVDHLRLLNHATNFTTALRINPGMRIYFANANLPVEKLNGSHNGRLIWIRDYTGFRSSTNITFPSGNSYFFNTALATSKDIDSDGDGYANAQDPWPFFMGDLEIEWVLPSPARPRISWDAVANATNILEFTADAVALPWQTLAVTNFPGGPTDAFRAVVLDELPGDRSRFYRVRVQRNGLP